MFIEPKNEIATDISIAEILGSASVQQKMLRDFERLTVKSQNGRVYTSDFVAIARQVCFQYLFFLFLFNIIFHLTNLHSNKGPRHCISKHSPAQ